MHHSIKTIRIILTVSGFLYLALLFTNCKKEYSYEGGTAVFNLLSLNGHCADPLVSGNYVAGATLGSSNTVQLQANVTATGKFSLQTNSQNGFQFSASGSLSDTGLQTITLNATGRPTTTGIFSFTTDPAPGCAFNVEVTGPQIQESDYSFAGAPNACTNVQVLGQYQKDKTLTASNIVVANVNVTTPGDYVIKTDTLDGISFYAAGHFSQAGNQAVTLSGTGTPVLPQNLQFTISGNNSGCSFPLTVDNAGNPATYVIQSGQNLCIGNIGGSYTAGTPLNASNTYTLLVYVAAVGNFTISTQTADGVVFYYTGEFTTLGDQNVTLVGSGTPTSVGNFTMSPEIVGPAPLGGKGCDFTMAVK
jgi:hypothetical protein